MVPRALPRVIPEHHRVRSKTKQTKVTQNPPFIVDVQLLTDFLASILFKTYHVSESILDSEETKMSKTRLLQGFFDKLVQERLNSYALLVGQFHSTEPLLPRHVSNMCQYMFPFVTCGYRFKHILFQKISQYTRHTLLVRWRTKGTGKK